MNITATSTTNDFIYNNSTPAVTITPTPTVTTIANLTYPAVSRLSWECVRCRRINAPHVDSCACTYSYSLPVYYPYQFPYQPWAPYSPWAPYVVSTTTTCAAGDAPRIPAA